MAGELDFRVSLQIEDLKKEVQKVQTELGKIGKTADTESKKIDSMFVSAGKGFATYFSARLLFDYAKQVALVRGEFQQLSVGFETMLKNKAQADQLMREVVEFAATTPLTLLGVGQGAKQLLAYGIAAEDVVDTLSSLGDIASGLKIPLGDMAYLYGTTMVQGRLYTRDLLQFTTRGIPLIEELAAVLKVNKNEVQGLVTAGRVGFPEVQKAIENMTSETGKFYNLMEKNSKTITGQISNLGDAFDVMLNNIGEANEGVIGSAIGGARYLIEHYEEIAKVLGLLVTMYGSYKAAVILTAAAQRASVAAGAIQGWIQLSRVVGTATTAQKAFNLAVKANPLGLIASAIATVVTAFILFNRETKTAADKLEDLEKATNDYAKSTKNLDSLIKDYENLSKKTSLSADETKRLNDSTRELANTVPDAVTEFNSMNNTLDLSIEKLKEYSTSRKESLARVLESSIEDNQKELEILNKQIALQRQIAEEGSTVTPITFPSRGGYTTVNQTNTFNSKERLEADEERQELEKRRDDLLSKIDQGKKTLNNIQGQQVQAEVKSYQEINKEIKVTSDNIKLLQNNLIDLREGRINSSDLLGDIKEIEAEIKSNQENLATLTGEKIKKENSDKLEEDRRKLADEAEQMQLDIDQARIDAMKDGLEKTLAQNELNFRKELSQINSQRREREAELKKAGVASDDSSYYQAMEKAATLGYQKANKIALDQEKEKNEELIREFETYQEKRLRIEEEYKVKIDKLQKAGGSSENIRVAEEERDFQLSRLDDEIASREASFRVWAEQIANIGLEQLVSSLESAKTALGTAQEYNLSDNEQAVLRAKINALESQIESLKARAESAPERGVKEWADTLKVMNQVQEQVGYMISDFEGLDDSTKLILQSATNVAGGIIGMITGMKELGIEGENALQGVGRAAVTLSVIGAGVQILSTVFNLFKKNAEVEEQAQQRVREITQSKIDQQRIYNQLLLEQNLLLEEAENIFGSNQITKAANAFSVYKDYIEQYKTELNKLGDAQVVIGVHTAPSGFLSLGKKQVDIYQKIGDAYDDLITKEGYLNIERAKAILQTEKMSDADRELLQTLLDLNDAAIKAQEELSKYLQDTFGSLGNDILDSLTTAITDGADAWTEFGKAGSKVLEDLGQQIAYTLFFSDQFDQLQKQLEEVYASGASESEIGKMAQEVVGFFYQGIGSQLDLAQGWMEQWQKQAEASGFDLWAGNAVREGASRGIASISQDSADELNGRFTTIQMHTMNISETVSLLAQNSQIQLNHLAAIETNTDRLSNIERDMSSIKSGINTMTTEGILLR